MGVVIAQESKEEGDKQAQKKPKTETVSESDSQPESATEAYQVATVTSMGSQTIGGQEVNYQVEAGTLELSNDEGDDKAKVFFVAYTKPGAKHAQRPVTFAFNGGPGSSSVWLHLGMLGPQRIVFPEDASFLRPPYHLSPNPYSLLDVTDLVFIDPVSTGFSRPTEDEKASQFHGYNEDIRSVGQFIHDWLSQYGRWDSPKFICGESYGGLRVAGLSGYLQSRYNLELNGAVVISGAINFQPCGSAMEMTYLTYASFRLMPPRRGITMHFRPKCRNCPWKKS